MSNEGRFEEKILYKTHQHWIVLVSQSCKLIAYWAFPLSLLTYFLSAWSWGWTTWVFFLTSLIVIGYDHYLWHHSWLLIGNQKITLSVRNGFFSQYAMNIRYRNIRDSAVSKNSMLGFLFKYGTLFVRSSANEGDFQARFVPKVGKVYAIVNALSRYSDEERTHIHTIEELHAFHQNKEFSHQNSAHSMSVEEARDVLKNIPGVTDVLELSVEAKTFIRSHEELRNIGVIETLARDHVLVFLHNDQFRDPAANIVEENAMKDVYFPSVPFPEIRGKRVTSGSPSKKVHEYLLQFFPYSDTMDASVLVWWDK